MFDEQFTFVNVRIHDKIAKNTLSESTQLLVNTHQYKVTYIIVKMYPFHVRHT